MALSQFFTNLWNNVKSAPTFVPSYIEFPPEQTDAPNQLAQFNERQHYFMMSVSEMFLSYQRLWHQNFYPMVFTVCGFKYGGKEIEIPYLIGPSLLKKYEQKVPKGMLYFNTPVVGMHPWRGGNVSLSVILCRVAGTNNAEKFLNVIEDVSGSLDFASGISQFTKVGRVVLNGIDTLLGFNQTEPLLGLNNNFGQAAGNVFKPGFHALIQAENLDKSKFWVKNNRLCYGNSLESSKEYRESDFVLFRIGISEKRHDLDSLPFYEEYNEIYDQISHLNEITQKERDLLRPKMLHLCVSIKQSPDLTWAQANRTWDEKVAEINDLLDDLSKLDGEKAKEKELNPTDAIMFDALSDLKF